MWAEIKNSLIACGRNDFQSEARTRFGNTLPGEADFAGLLCLRHLGGAADNDSARLQAGSGAQDAIPQIVGRSDGKPNGLSFLFSYGKNFGKQQLLDGAEKLVGTEIVFTRCGAPQQTNVKDNRSE